MAAPLRISGRIDLDAAPAVQGGQAAVAAVASVGAAADQTSVKLDRLEQAAAGLGTAADRNVYAERVKALGSEGKALDDLRARYNPLYATMRSYKQEVAAIETAHAAGILSTKEMTVAIEQQRQAAMRSVDVIREHNKEVKEGAANQNGAQNFNTANIAAQFQDIGVTAAMGMDPLQIALQQGTQLSSVIGGMEKPVAGLFAAFTSLVSPISLVTIGAVAAAAATLQWLTSSEDKTKSLDDALSDQEKTLKRLAEAYGGVAIAAEKAGNESTRFLTGLANSNQAALKIAVAAEAESFFTDDKVGSRTRAGFDAIQPEFQAALVKLRNDVKAGKADFETFYATMEKQVAANPSLAKEAAEIIALTEKLRGGTDALSEFQRIKDAVFNDRGSNGMLLSQGATNRDDMGNYALFQQQDRVQRERNREAALAEIARMRARSPAEREAAARQSASADHRDESAAERRQRINLAGLLALTQAEKELTDARRQRNTALQSTMEKQQLEADLIGKTVGEQERLRMEYQLTAELKAEAARTGTAVDEKELAGIREKAAAYGQLAERMVARKALLAQDQELDKLRSQIALVGESSTAQAEVLRALETETKIRELGISRNSVEAQQMREKARLAAELTTELNRQKAAWDAVASASESMIDNAFDALMKGDFKGVMNSLLKDTASFFGDLAKNSLKNSLLGGDRTELSDVVKLFTGAKAAPATAANDNAAFAAPLAAVTRAPLSGTGSAVDVASSLLGFSERGQRGDINSFLRNGGVDIDAAQTAWCAGFVNSSLEQIGVKGSGSLTANSFQNWGQKVDIGSVMKGDVLVDTNGLGANQQGGHVGFATGATQMGANGLQLEMLSGNSGDAVTKRWFDAVDLQARRATETAGALSTVGKASGAATQGLGTLSNGLGEMGQNLANAFPAAPTSGGGGFFSSILSAFMPNFVPNGAQATGAATGGWTGLFDTGGWTGDMGRGDIAGFVHGQEYVVKASVVAQPGVRALLEGLNSGKGYASGGFVDRIGAPSAIYPSPAETRAAAANTQSAGNTEINVYVDNPRGDRDIEEAVDRGVSKGIRKYDANLPGRIKQVSKRSHVRGQ